MIWYLKRASRAASLVACLHDQLVLDEDERSRWTPGGGRSLTVWLGVVSPPTSIAMDRFVRIDADEAVITWMNLPGTYLRLLALAPDRSPLVQASIANAEAAWRVPEPEKGQEVFRVSSGGLSGTFPDQYGTWIGGAQSGDGAGIFLFTTGGGLRKMSDFSGVPFRGLLVNRPTLPTRHAHLPRGRECHVSTEVAVTHQPKVCDTSAEGLWGPVSRTCTP